MKTKMECIDRKELMDSLVEIEMNSDDDFYIIIETLTRMGVTNQRHIENDLLLEAEDIMTEIRDDEERDVDEFPRLNQFLRTLDDMVIDTPTLFQTCYILHKQGRYYIMHFKELFALDGRKVNITTEDIARRNAIVSKIESWGHCRVCDPEKIKSPVLAGRNSLVILPYAQKSNWNLESKYSIGAK